MTTAPSKPPGAAKRRNSSGLARDIEILEALADPDTPPEGLGVVRIADVIGRDKATVSRAMATLAEFGLLSRDEESRLYRIGPQIFAYAARSLEAALVREARPFLRRVARHSRETTHLSVLRGGLVLTLISELSPNEVRTVSWEGMSSNPFRTPSGRVLVSDWTDVELVEWYAEHSHPARDVQLQSAYAAATNAPAAPAPPWFEKAPGASAVTDLASLLAEEKTIRQRGFATSDEEFEHGVVAASAPVRDHTNRVVAAISVSAPKGRVGVHLDRFGSYVAQAAQQLSHRLGAE